MKRYLSTILSVLGAISIVASGCGSKTEPITNTGTNTTDKADSNLTAPGTLPIVKEKVTLKAFVHTRPNSDDYVNNEATKFLEEKTNVHLEFVTAIEGEAKQKLNLLLSSGDHPDILLGGWSLSRPEVDLYASQGIFLPLDELVEKHGFWIKKAFEQYPKAKDFAAMSDGKIYTIPDISDALHTADTWKMWFYKPFMDKLNLELPKTTDDLYNVLKAIKTQDPNGNGKADEIPAAGAQRGWSTTPDVFLMNAFAYNDGGDRLWIDNGKVEATYTKPEYKEGLKYIRKLVSEGLLAKESFTQDGNALIQMGENPNDPILGASWGGYEGTFADLGNSKRWLDWEVGQALKGPNGIQLAPLNENYAFQIKSLITNKCKYPEVAIRLFDTIYDPDINMVLNNGKEGVGWRKPEAGEEGYAGPARFFRITTLEKLPKNTIWDQMGSWYQDEAFRIGEVIDVESNPMEKILYEGTRDMYRPYFPKDENMYPKNVIPTKEATQELSTLGAQINTKVNEMTARFCIGDVDIDNGWDQYLKELDQLGLQRFIELKQKAYDDYMKIKK
jgi:putative aldouronate transport system substrate-binding protein